MTLPELMTILDEWLPQDYGYEAEPYTLTPEERRAEYRRKPRSTPSKGHHVDIYHKRNPDIIETVFIHIATTRPSAIALISHAVQVAQGKYQQSQVVPVDLIRSVH